MPRPKKLILQHVVRPKGIRNSYAADPADAPAMRRYVEIYRLVTKRGMSEEDAIAFYDRPKGFCTKTLHGAVCGAPAKHPQGEVCARCDKEIKQERCRQFAKKRRVLKTCPVQDCGVQFYGHTYCPAHKGGRGRPPKERNGKRGRPPKDPSAKKAVKAKRPPRPPKPRRPVRPPKAMPDTWEKKSKKITEVEIVEPQKPCGKPVTYFDATGRKFSAPPKQTGLRDLFGSSGPSRFAID